MSDLILPTEWAYAAGLIDGEGCISISGGNQGTLSLNIEVGMKGANPALLWLEERFGGTLFDGSSGMCHWYLHAKEKESFLRGILPYTRLKNRQIAIALAFLETKNPSTTAFTEEQRLIRERLRNMLSEEKRRPHVRPNFADGVPTPR